MVICLEIFIGTEAEYSSSFAEETERFRRRSAIGEVAMQFAGVKECVREERRREIVLAKAGII